MMMDIAMTMGYTSRAVSAIYSTVVEAEQKHIGRVEIEFYNH